MQGDQPARELHAGPLPSASAPEAAAMIAAPHCKQPHFTATLSSSSSMFGMPCLRTTSGCGGQGTVGACGKACWPHLTTKRCPVSGQTSAPSSTCTSSSTWCSAFRNVSDCSISGCTSAGKPCRPSASCGATGECRAAAAHREQSGNTPSPAAGRASRAWGRCVARTLLPASEPAAYRAPVGTSRTGVELHLTRLKLLCLDEQRVAVLDALWSTLRVSQGWQASRHSPGRVQCTFTLLASMLCVRSLIVKAGQRWRGGPVGPVDDSTCSRPAQPRLA